MGALLALTCKEELDFFVPLDWEDTVDIGRFGGEGEGRNAPGVRGDGGLGAV